MSNGMKRLLISWIVTPERVRKLVCRAVSWLMSYCMVSGAWDTITSFSKWLRRVADFIDKWNDTELPDGKDALIADTVSDAISDERVNTLIDIVSAMGVRRHD